MTGDKRGLQSANEQFNEQYDATIQAIQSRAIWRVGERRDEVEAFRCLCPKCGYESRHRRDDITRHQLLFGKSIRQLEAARPVVVCERCGLERHARDIGDLVVPTTMRLYDEARRAAERLTIGPDSDSGLDRDTRDVLHAFRDEASGPVRLQLFTDIASKSSARQRSILAEIGTELSLTSRQIDESLDQLS